MPSARASRQHPLAGMWKGMYGPHGLEMQRVEYRFDGPSAKIVAVKVLGDANVPAGQITWKVRAAGGMLLRVLAAELALICCCGLVCHWRVYLLYLSIHVPV